MRVLRVLLFLLIAVSSYGQFNQKGLPLLRNFLPEEYDASDQNWSVAQDHRGVMYFGNNDQGILEYDGKTWRKIPVPRNALVRSLAADSLGTIYVGIIGDFGYLSPTHNGGIEYKSLFELVTDSIGPFSDIYKIHVFKGKVYFFNRNFLFVYDGEKVDVKSINPDRKFYNLFSFVANNRYYVGSYTEGLRELIDDELVIAPNGNYFAKKNIMAIAPYKGNWVNIVSNTGLYRYNQVTGDVVNITNLNKFYNIALDDALPYHAIPMTDASLGIAYIVGKNYSFAQLDSMAKPLRVINKANGLLDETVTYAYQTKTDYGSSPLWLPLNVGIARADIHSQISRFSEESGIRGGILGVTRFNNRLFVLTMSGVFYQDFDKDGFAYFKQIPQINSAAWSHLHFREPKTGQQRLLIGTITSGIFEIDNRFRVTSISSSPEFAGKIAHVAYSMFQPEHNPDIVYLGMGGSLAAIRWDGQRWLNVGRLFEGKLRSEYRSIVSVKPKEIWLGTYVDGVTRVTFDKDTVITHFGVNDGLAALKDNIVFTLKNKVYIATGNGVYSLNEQSGKLEPALLPGLNKPIEGKGIIRMIPYDEGYVMACHLPNGSRWIEMVKPGEDGNDVVERRPFRSLPSRWTDYFFEDSDGTLWIAISTELFTFDKTVKRNFNDSFNALIRKVVIKGDSVLFNGTFIKENKDGKVVVGTAQTPKQTPTLSYGFNSATFEVASTFFEKEDATEYSFMLVGFDKDWSRWTTTPNPIYTNIPEGSYTFKVKARNIYGIESSVAEYSFSIKPPWYRSIFAYISYVIMLALLVWGIVVFNTRRLIAEKERLEQIVQERTAEVVAQKEELEHQRDKIFEQNEEIKSSINYASRIQNALLTPVETINDIFDDYFIMFLPRDIVSGDFYWLSQVGNRKICVVADCTGHGVPGGFMSMLGIGFLTQIMAKGEPLTASQILDQLRAMIIQALHQTGKSGENKDGMDLALYIVDSDKGHIEFAGANNPLVLIRDNEIIHYKGDKMPIGIHLRCDTPFENQIIEYKKGDVIYTFSDGYPDQFGGPDLRKFMIKNLKELFLSIHSKPMAEQREILYKALHDWQGETPRIDDVVVMGVRL
jgi:serine phosphatase RsbU (regulator of sigma subunit)